MVASRNFIICIFSVIHFEILCVCVCMCVCVCVKNVKFLSRFIVFAYGFLIILVAYAERILCCPMLPFLLGQS